MKIVFVKSSSQRSQQSRSSRCWSCWCAITYGHKESQKALE